MEEDSSSSDSFEVIAETETADAVTIENHPQMADALAKVLRMSGKKILSKAKLLTSAKKGKQEKPAYDFEVEGGSEAAANSLPDVKEEEDDDDVKPDSKELLKSHRISKREKLERGRLKPTAQDREKEKPLVKIATKGVIQLFNAVKQQQNKINKQISVGGITEVKKDKILKSIDKNEFLDVLMGSSNGKVETKKQDESIKEIKVEEDEENEEEGWEVLRNDFIMGAKLKDWDKKGDTEGSDEPKVKKRKKSVRVASFLKKLSKRRRSQVLR